jgi:hypothetical protein
LDTKRVRKRIREGSRRKIGSGSPLGGRRAKRPFRRAASGKKRRKTPLIGGKRGKKREKRRLSRPPERGLGIIMDWRTVRKRFLAGAGNFFYTTIKFPNKRKNGE